MVTEQTLQGAAYIGTSSLSFLPDIVLPIDPFFLLGFLLQAAQSSIFLGGSAAGTRLRYPALSSGLSKRLPVAHIDYSIYLYSGFMSPFSTFSYSVSPRSGPAFSLLLF